MTKSLVFKSNKGISLKPLVTQVVEEIRENKDIFIVISRVFSQYTKSGEAIVPEVVRQLRRHLDIQFDSLSEEKIDLVCQLISNIYRLDESKFSDVKSKILESTVYHFGPVSSSIKGNSSFKCHVEPTILFGDFVVGESENKCDLVFYNDETRVIEFIECKARIETVIPWNLSFDKVKKSVQDKVKYLEKVRLFFIEHQGDPSVYLACFTSNYERELKNLHENWKFEFIDFVNPDELINGKIK